MNRDCSINTREQCAKNLDVSIGTIARYDTVMKFDDVMDGKKDRIPFKGVRKER